MLEETNKEQGGKQDRQNRKNTTATGRHRYKERNKAGNGFQQSRTERKKI